MMHLAHPRKRPSDPLEDAAPRDVADVYLKRLKPRGEWAQFTALSSEARFFVVTTRVLSAKKACEVLTAESEKESGLVNSVWRRGQNGARSIFSHFVEQCAVAYAGGKTDDYSVFLLLVKHMLTLSDVDVNIGQPLAKVSFLRNMELILALASHPGIDADIRFGPYGLPEVHETALECMLVMHHRLHPSTYSRNPSGIGGDVFPAFMDASIVDERQVLSGPSSKKDLLAALLALCRASSEATLTSALSKGLKDERTERTTVTAKNGEDFWLIDVLAVVAWHVPGVKARREARVGASKAVKKGMMGWLERAQTRLGAYGRDGAARARDLTAYQQEF